MPTTGAKKNATRPKDSASTTQTPDDFPAELRGEFEEVGGQLAANIGTVAGMAVSSGGYFGISITDDGGSVRLAVRHGTLALDRRFYTVGQLESALAYLVGKLRDA
jgi:hypothetical protein